MHEVNTRSDDGKENKTSEEIKSSGEYKHPSTSSRVKKRIQ